MITEWKANCIIKQGDKRIKGKQNELVVFVQYVYLIKQRLCLDKVWKDKKRLAINYKILNIVKTYWHLYSIKIEQNNQIKLFIIFVQ